MKPFFIHLNGPFWQKSCAMKISDAIERSGVEEAFISFLRVQSESISSKRNIPISPAHVSAMHYNTHPIQRRANVVEDHL